MSTTQRPIVDKVTEIVPDVTKPLNKVNRERVRKLLAINSMVKDGNLREANKIAKEIEAEDEDTKIPCAFCGKAEWQYVSVNGVTLTSCCHSG